MDNNKKEKKYFYGKVASPISDKDKKELLQDMFDFCYTGSIAWGHEFRYSYVDYKYSTENYGLFGLLSREVKEKVIKYEFFPIIFEKKENYYVDILSGEIYKSPALPGQVAFLFYRDVDTIWLANYLKGMTKEKVDIYINMMKKLKAAVFNEYCRRHDEEIKSQNEYNEAEKYINEFRKKYKR